MGFERTPYLSVVVTSRNDNHGGDLNHRMQIFIHGFISQCRRFNLTAELIIVEWNPPGDKPPLAEQFLYPVQDSPCVVRIVTVPAELHRRFAYSDQLPLFQMIAKNVGIRRARGKFVLATNIDLLFSDDLMAFLAKRSLKPGILYRVDRHDVDSGVPEDAPIDTQLEYCQSHLLRICAREAVIEVQTGTYYWIYLPTYHEIVQQVRLSLTGNAQEKRLSQNHIRSIVQAYSDRIKRRALLPFAVSRRLLGQTVSVATGGVRWLSYLPPRIRRLRRRKRSINLRRFERRLQAVSGQLKLQAEHWLALPGRILKSFERTQPTITVHKLVYRLRLFTNACGDFTLMSREDWFALRAYPELELFSLHIDSLMLYIAHYGGVKERTLPPTMVTYHIEHKGGWTPENARDGSLDKRLREKKIEQLTMEMLYDYIWTMEQQKHPIEFNDADWGLAEAELAEIELKHTTPSPVT